MIAAFYGGELVWRERDRKLNEIIDSTPVPSWVMTVPKILAIFVVLLVINFVGMLTGLAYQLIQGAPQLGLAQYLGWFIVPAAIDGLLIAVLAVVLQILSPNKYVGWGLLFIWFVGTIFLNNMGYSNPLYAFPQSPTVPLSDFVGAGSFWKGALTLQFYWACFALILAVIAHLLWPRGTDLGLKVRLARAARQRKTAPLAIAGVAAVAMAATGAYAYHNIKTLNRYETSDEVEKYSADLERKYLKYENLPRPVVTKVVLDAQLFPAERRLLVNGRYDLRNDTTAPIRDVHVRSGDRDIEWLKLDLAGARLVSDDAKFGYRIYRFDAPLAPGRDVGADLHLALVAPRLPGRKSRHRPARKRHLREQFPVRADHRHGPPGTAQRPHPAPPPGPARRTAHGQARGPVGDRQELHRDRLGPVRHHADHRRRPDPDRAGQPRRPTTTQGGRRTARFVSPAPILNFFSIQSADYQVATRNHNGVELVGLLPARPRLERAQDAEGDGVVARLLPRQLRPLSVQLCADHRIPRLCQFRAGVRGDDALFGIDRLQRQHQRPDQDRLHDLRHRARDRAPILGAPGDRRRDPGRHADQRDARPIFGADGDEEALRPRPDPPLPQA